MVPEAALYAAFQSSELEYQTLQPEGSLTFGSKQFTDTEHGWGGAYRWTGQAVEEGDGTTSGRPNLECHDLLVVREDADVAHSTCQRLLCQVWAAASMSKRSPRSRSTSSSQSVRISGVEAMSLRV